MSLKDLTKDKHTAAENTKFMKAIFKNNLPLDLWADYTYNKVIWYGAIEYRAKELGLLEDLPGIERRDLLLEDYKEMTFSNSRNNFNLVNHKIRDISLSYSYYILKLQSVDKVLAHLYTWHMGDLHGGQMIKKVINAPHRNLEFVEPASLITNLRAKLNDSLAEEANVAFDWAIKIMESYDADLG
jgi:heme oxygenase